MYKLERSLNIVIVIAAYLLLFPEIAAAHSDFAELYYILMPCVGIFALTYAVSSDSKHLLKVSGILLFITLIIIAIGVVGESIGSGFLLIILIPYLIVFSIVGLVKKFLHEKK